MMMMMMMTLNNYGWFFGGTFSKRNRWQNLETPTWVAERCFASFIDLPSMTTALQKASGSPDTTEQTGPWEDWWKLNLTSTVYPFFTTHDVWLMLASSTFSRASGYFGNWFLCIQPCRPSIWDISTVGSSVTVGVVGGAVVLVLAQLTIKCCGIRSKFRRHKVDNDTS